VAETFLLVDGENIDTTLGVSLLGRRPAPEERPRWDRVLDYARAIWEQPARLGGRVGRVPLSGPLNRRELADDDPGRLGPLPVDGVRGLSP
jgi:hypothetical protein